jgi:glycosyltransferase involved in cell wall biosynthesis
LRITYFNYEWDLRASTGAATQLAQTAAGLERLGHEVLVVDRHRMPAVPQAGAARRFAHPWLWDAANHWRSLRGIPAELRILRRHRPDVVLTLHALRFSSIVAARRSGVPVVLQVNASVPDEIRRYRPGVKLLPALSGWVERRMVAAADGVIVVSSVLRDFFAAAGAPPKRLFVVPNGADTRRFRPEAADARMRAQFPGRVLVGFAGSFAPFHGIDLLEYAIRETEARYPQAHFLLAGGGPGAADLRRRLECAGRGRNAAFLGQIPHDRMPAVLAAADVLLAPYGPENFFYFSPIKLFEYMASGRAVLAARLGQIAQVIEDGRNGLLYDPADRRDFACRLFQLLSEPAMRSGLGAAARRTVEERYTWDHNAKLVSEVLESVRRAR